MLKSHRKQNTHNGLPVRCLRARLPEPQRSQSGNALASTQTGFSLVEILVSLSILTVVVTISVGALLVLIDANAKAQTIKSSMDNLSFALDSMTRNVRTGYEYRCHTSISSGTPLPDGTRDCAAGGVLVYTDGETGDRVGYRLNSERIERNINNGGWSPLTAVEARINTLQFVVSGTATYGGSSDIEQPRVSIWIEGEVGEFAETRTDFALQTTVTQRILDF